jgi:hypothetical protein
MLDAVTELLLPEMSQQRQLFLIILSDGAPSDHNDRACEHGVNVWHEDMNVPPRPAGKKALNRCNFGGKGSNCRQNVIKAVREECLQKIVRCGIHFIQGLHAVVEAVSPLSRHRCVVALWSSSVPRAALFLEQLCF